MPKPADLNLPDPATLIHRLYSLFVLELVSTWGRGSDTVFRALDGGGTAVQVVYDGTDHVSFLQTPEGSMVWGFAHESAMSPWRHEDDPRTMGGVLDATPRDLIWPGVLDELPSALFDHYEAVRQDPLMITWASWWQDGRWVEGPVERVGADADGRHALCEELPITEERVARTLGMPRKVISAVYARKPIDEKLIRAAEPTIRDSFVRHTLKALHECGYPTVSPQSN